MYGYIRPDRGELRGREYELFRAEYCALCHTLCERYGQTARFAVNYDFTFMAIVLSSQRPETVSLRCPVHPIRKRAVLRTDNALESAADYSVILAWWKMSDTAEDEKGAVAAASLACQTVYRNVYRRAAMFRPAFDANVRKCLSELKQLEISDDPSLDRAADCFARILAEAASEAQNEDDRRIKKELFYHVGRSIYILDAVDDLASDIRTGSYNPLRHRIKPGEEKLDEGEIESLRSTLNLSQRCAAAALSLRTPDLWQPVLENIIMVGLPEVSSLVLAGEWNKRNKRESVPLQGVDKR